MHKRRVALFDGGPSNLFLENGKEYSYSDWMPGWVKNKIFPEGSAKIGLIADHNLQRVSDKESADMSFYPFGKGAPEYYKEGELEIVAHSETPLNRKSELVIACRGSTYNVNVTAFKLLCGKADVYESGQRIASIRNILFWFTAIFEKEMPLLDCIFICLLTAFYTDEG